MLRIPTTPFALLLAIVSVSGAVAAAPTGDVDSAAAEAMRTTGAKGLAIAVVDAGHVVGVHSYGHRNASGSPLTSDTVMYGASLTKALFGFLAVALAAESRLDLDTPIAALLPRPLPSYGNPDAYGHWGDLIDDDRWRVITPRMALNHATGFANFAWLEPDGRLRIHFDPGTRYAYSGEGIMLLQFGLERGLGLDIERELQRRLFQPLGLSRTSLKWQAVFADNYADGWDSTGHPVPHDERSRVRAAGSLDTSIREMAELAAAMVRGDGLPPRWFRQFNHGTLPIKTRQQFPTLLPDAPEAARPAAAAALGVIAFSGPQGLGWYKGGHDDITANTLVCLMEHQRCVVIMANDVRAEAAFPTLVRRILGDTGVPFGWEYPGLPTP